MIIVGAVILIRIWIEHFQNMNNSALMGCTRARAGKQSSATYINAIVTSMFFSSMPELRNVLKAYSIHNEAVGYCQVSSCIQRVFYWC